MSYGKWRHSMCVKCFRKRWPRRKIWGWQVPEKLREWEICCFCFIRHKSGIHMRKDPRSRELMCSVHAEKVKRATA
jgi:hypothetical protein